MHLSATSHRIRQRILLEAIQHGPTDMDAWRSCLPLLSVCMYWREALYPLVYQWVFFEPVVGAEPDDVSVISNIELIASANMCNALSLVRLKIPEIPLHNIYFEKLLRLLTPYGGRLASICTFVIDGCSTTPVYSDEADRLNRETSSMRDRSMVLAYRLRLLFPNISHLYFNDKTCPIQSHMIRYLIEEYLPQLRLVNIHDIRIPLGFQSWSTNLSHLSLRLSGSSDKYILPPIVTKSLQYLCLYGLSRNFDWSLFSDDCWCENIAFSNLICLKLSFLPFSKGCKRRPNTFRFAMSFPRLKHLELYDVPDICDILFAHSFPRVTHLNIRSSSLALQQLSKISFGMLENVTIDITLFNNKLEAYYSSVNALVDQMKNSRRSDLALDSHLSTIRLDLVKWDCLTSLSILGGMALHDSVKLLQRLPLLKRLEICGLEFDGYGINSYEYGKIGTGYGMFPLDSCIENLTIVNTFDHPFPAILHLLTLVSKVKVLQTDPKHIAELEQRIAHLGSQYPHLQNIKLLSI